MYQYRIIAEQELILLRFRGKITFDDFVNCFREATQDEAFSAEYNGITDLRSIDPGYSAEQAIELAELVVSEHLSKGKWAVLVTEPMVTALTMLYESIVRQQHPVKLYSTIEKASEYLNIDAPYLFDLLKDEAWENTGSEPPTEH